MSPTTGRIARRGLLQELQACLELTHVFSDRALEREDLAALRARNTDQIEPFLERVVKEAGRLAEADLRDAKQATTEYLAWTSQMVSYEVSGIRGSLATSQNLADPLDVLGLQSGAVHRMMRALLALERTLRMACGLPIEDLVVQFLGEELFASIEVRIVYGVFRGKLLESEGSDLESITKLLRLAGVQIARLTGSDTYELLRLSDRKLFRSLQSRIIAWLSSGADDLDEGRETWQDLIASSALLSMVNRRSQLMAYDRIAIARSIEELQAGETPTFDAWTLWGRDPELDHCIERGEGFLAAENTPILERVQRSLPENADGGEYTEEVFPEVLERVSELRSGKRAASSGFLPQRIKRAS